MICSEQIEKRLIVWLAKFCRGLILGLPSTLPYIGLSKPSFMRRLSPDVATHPLPPPHPELTKYFEPPKRVLKRSRNVLECIEVSKVEEGAQCACQVRQMLTVYI